MYYCWIVRVKLFCTAVLLDSVQYFVARLQNIPHKIITPFQKGMSYTRGVHKARVIVTKE